MALDPIRYQKDIDYFDRKSKELDIKGKDLIKLRVGLNKMKKALAAKNESEMVKAINEVRSIVAIYNKSMKKNQGSGSGSGSSNDNFFKNKYRDEHGNINKNRIIEFIRNKMEATFGSLAGAKQHYNLSLNGMDKVRYDNERKTYIFFKNAINNTLSNMADKKDIRAYSIIMNVIEAMAKKTRIDLFARIEKAVKSKKWNSQTAKNLKLFKSLDTLISASTVDEAVDDLFVIYDDLPDETKQLIGKQPSGPSPDIQDLSSISNDEQAVQWLKKHGMDVDEFPDNDNEIQNGTETPEPIAEDFKSKIRGIFNEAYNATYKKSIIEALKK